jgi:ubiquinone/menaquinone biosynthesis C-methylase UbiE
LYILDFLALPDSSVHAIVATNALHYIANPESFAEIGRVLVPGGITAFICNYVNLEAAPWLQAIYDLSEAAYQKVGVKFTFNRNGLETGWQGDLKNTGVFDEIKTEFTTHSDSITEGDALKLFMSYGSFQYCSDEEKKEIQKKLEKILKDNYSGIGESLKELPMKSFMYLAKKKIST